MASRNDVATSPIAGAAEREDARIEISGLTKRFLTPAGEVFTALQGVSFTVDLQDGQIEIQVSNAQGQYPALAATA